MFSCIVPSVPTSYSNNELWLHYIEATVNSVNSELLRALNMLYVYA